METTDSKIARPVRKTVVMTVDFPGCGQREIELAIVNKEYMTLRKFERVLIQIPSAKASWQYSPEHYLLNEEENSWFIIGQNWSHRDMITDLIPDSHLSYLWMAKRFYLKQENPFIMQDEKEVKRGYPAFCGLSVVADITVKTKREKNRIETILDIEIYGANQIEPLYAFSEGDKGQETGLYGLKVPGTVHYLFFKKIEKQKPKIILRKK
jgi:hypothetical protein